MIRDKEFTFTAEEEGRLDIVSSKVLDIPRSVFSNPSIIISVDGKEAKKSRKLKPGEMVHLTYKEEIMEGLEKEEIPLDILYEDSDILVINKEQGMTVHPGAGTYTGTLANALLGLYGEDFDTGVDSLRPGIVHRLDKDTSGVMVIAKTIVRDRDNRKKYTVTDNMSQGKDALTKWKRLSQGKNYALLSLRIFTGRTHQIRVHLSSISHPILGDPIYSRKDDKYPEATLMLHAYMLVFNHPVTKERMVFKAPLPDRFFPIFEKEGIEWRCQEQCDSIEI